MSCAECQVNPTAHSFESLGHSNQWSVYYTAPSKATTKAPEAQQLHAFKVHLQSIQGPWIWVFDCSGMGLKHCRSFSFTKTLGELIATHHDKTLQCILILQPTMWMRETIRACKTLFASDLTKKVIVLDGGKLELYKKLEDQQLTTDVRRNVLKACGLI